MLYNDRDTPFSLQRGGKIAEVLALNKKPGLRLLESLLHQRELMKNKTSKKKPGSRLGEFPYQTGQKTDMPNNLLGNNLEAGQMQKYPLK
jgi:hypothetical protein